MQVNEERANPTPNTSEHWWNERSSDNSWAARRLSGKQASKLRTSPGIDRLWRPHSHPESKRLVCHLLQRSVPQESHAALHHAAYLDRQVRAVHSILDKTGGILVNFDYTGPHRNQYDEIEWDKMIEVNERSSPAFRKKKLRYPRLSAMLKSDPSEAIHSELIIPTSHRYFKPLWNRSVNGGIAYELLTHNENLAQFRDIVSWELNAGAEVKSHFNFVLANDEEHARRRPNSMLFWYSIMQPKSNLNVDLLLKWTEEERVREETAEKNGGVYYASTYVAARYPKNPVRWVG